MDEHYDSLFDDQDEEDADFRVMIPTIDSKVLHKVLENDLEIINNSNLSVVEWSKFKLELLKCEKEWKTQVFFWIPYKLDGKYPYIGVQINWDVLENKSTRYFQVHMCFENVWFGSKPLTNVWEVLDK